MDIFFSAVVCDCGHLMEQDDDAAWTCFNERCPQKGRTFLFEVKPVERKREKLI